MPGGVLGGGGTASISLLCYSCCEGKNLAKLNDRHSSVVVSGVAAQPALTTRRSGHSFSISTVLQRHRDNGACGPPVAALTRRHLRGEIGGMRSPHRRARIVVAAAPAWHRRACPPSHVGCGVSATTPWCQWGVRLAGAAPPDGCSARATPPASQPRWRTPPAWSPRCRR